jgi:hypothetical protein
MVTCVANLGFLIEGGINFLKTLSNFQDIEIDQQKENYDIEHLLMLPVNITGMMEGTNFVKGEHQIVDYRGKAVLAAFTPLNIEDVNWQFVTKVDATQAYAFLQEYLIKNAIYCLVFGLILVPFITLFATSIAHPLQKLSVLTRSIWASNFSDKYQYQSKSVIGDLSNNINGINTMLAEHQSLLKDIIAQLSCNPTVEQRQPDTLQLLTVTLQQQINSHKVDETLWQAPQKSQVPQKNLSYLFEEFQHIKQLGIAATSQYLQLIQNLALDKQNCKIQLEQMSEQLSLLEQFNHSGTCELQDSQRQTQDHLKSLLALLDDINNVTGQQAQIEHKMLDVVNKVEQYSQQTTLLTVQKQG